MPKGPVLEGKAAIILGAATRDNMGQVMVRRFIDEGARVLAAGRNEDALKALAGETGCEWIRCDLTSRADVDAMIAACRERFGSVDVAINSTGWGLLAPFEDTTEEQLRQMAELQFFGPCYLLQALGRVMREQFEATGRGGASVIQISSAKAKIMLNNHAAYMATKAAIDHLIRVMAFEYGQYGVRANTISPGLTDTPMASEAIKAPGLLQAFEREYPMGRIGTADDIAAAAVFVASDNCYMTGENFQVNGGLCLRRNPTNAEIEASVATAMAES